MKKIELFSILTCLLSACSAESQAGPVVSKNELCIVSFNVRSDIDGKLSDGDNSWCYRQDASEAMIKEIKPDVCGMQEVRPHQLYDMEAAHPNYRFIGVGRDDGVNKGERMTIMFNVKTIKILDWGTYWLSETPDIPSKGWDAAYPRTATWAKFRHTPSGKEFFFVNTHLDHRGALAKKNGLQLIWDRIAAMNPEGLPLILTGDFNVTPSNEALRILEGKMQSARVVAEDSDDKGSFNGFSEGSRKIIDYIYFSGFSRCKDFKVIDKTYKKVPYISDHYPIRTQLEW